jgi:glycosyltransferase involved in cell wall biosynthesis
MAGAAPPQPHVLTLIDALSDGGAESIAEELAVCADQSRFRRTMCVTRSIDPLLGEAPAVSAARLREAGVQVIFLGRRKRFDIRSTWQLMKLLRSQRVDLVHAHMFGSNVWAAVLGRILDIPVTIGHEHTWSFEGQLLRRFADRNIVGRFCDAVIAVSEADRRRMISVVGMPAKRVVLIANGISERGPGDPRAIRRELGIPEQAPVLVQTAVLRPQKAIEVMLSAMTILRESHPDARLLVPGAGDSRSLEATAARLGVADAVHFLGLRDDVNDILAGATVGVLSSDFEGSPLAVLEYMAAGLPVVATDVGGLPQMVEEGRTGFLVPRRDPAALAQRVRELLDDPDLAQRMGERGRALQQQEFSRGAMTARVEQLYVQLLTAKGIGVPDPAPALGLAAAGRA